MEKYIYSLGLMLSDVKIDQKGRMFILVEEKSPGQLYKEIEIPEQYQTLENINMLKEFMEETCVHSWENGRCVLCNLNHEPDDFSGATPGDR